MDYVCFIAAEGCWGSFDCLAEAVCVPEKTARDVLLLIGGTDKPTAYYLPSREAAEQFLKNAWQIVCNPKKREEILKMLGAEELEP